MPAPTSLPTAISAMTQDELSALFKSWGEPAFRARQVLEFVYHKGIASADQITNLSQSLRQRLKAEAPLYELQLAQRSEADEAAKFLWKATDGALIESVQLRTAEHVTSCLSSQVGCAMGCAFCATGLSGFERHLRTHEIVEQYLLMWAHSGVHASHVVFMGMGEPLHNYEQVLNAVRRLNAPPPDGPGIGARRITISTVGIVPGIEKLAQEKLQLELAISLHAPDEQTRQKLIPAARRYPIAQIMQAAQAYCQQTHRLITYEYVLLAGVNDSQAQAHALAQLLRTHACKANLIPFNAVSGTPFQAPSRAAQEQFKRVLDEAGIPTTIRFSKGRGVDAACGQLRRHASDK